MSRTKPRSEASVEASRGVEQPFKLAREMMDKAGFKITAPVKVSVDPQLPFMGYTTPEGDSFHIVVSGGSVGSGMLEGLLVHEMSHIYRIQSKHPSHNYRILDEAVSKATSGVRVLDYQEKILHDLLNDIQDLYADDIAFQVFRSGHAAFLNEATEFMQDWVKDEPARSGDKVRDRWENASVLVHNARSLAQMQRHHIEDVGNRAVEKNERFLATTPHEYGEGFKFFRNELLLLREDLTEKDYSLLLAEHLKNFMILATPRSA